MSSDQAVKAPTGWAERARLGELPAVLYAGGSERQNLLLHGTGLFAAKLALRLYRRECGREGVLLDYGCGNGRMVRFFGKAGLTVVGTEITAEMLAEARKLGLPAGTELHLTDGVSIPLADNTINMIWISGVLKYSLFPPGSACLAGHESRVFIPVASDSDRHHELLQQPRTKYRDVIRELHRVLKPNGLLVNCEMWVDSPPTFFTREFEELGFTNRCTRVLRRYRGLPERLFGWRDWVHLPPRLVLTAGQIGTGLRYYFDNPRRKGGGFRDYLFAWKKSPES